LEGFLSEFEKVLDLAQIVTQKEDFVQHLLF